MGVGDCARMVSRLSLVGPSAWPVSGLAKRDDAQELTDAKRRTDFESCAKLLAARKKILRTSRRAGWRRRFPKLITTAPVAA